MFTSELIKKAWQIRKAAAERFGCRVSEIAWGLCLKMAKGEAEMESKHSENEKRVIALWSKNDRVTKWEFGFLESLVSRIERFDVTLTEKQLSVISRMEEKYRGNAYAPKARKLAGFHNHNPR